VPDNSVLQLILFLKYFEKFVEKITPPADHHFRENSVQLKLAGDNGVTHSFEQTRKKLGIGKCRR
jgi:hypothetical protein